jgi:signal transduction histidine kinase
LQQLFTLAQECDDRGDEWLMQEVRVMDADGEGPERIYQAVASSVRQGNDNERLVAIILHDITEQMHFFSMVAHELRKPLTSLSGFVKVILRGQAGPLTPLQSEFLQIADEQGTLLNGRIEELLQFHRMKAGKMSIELRVNDLVLVIAGVVSRLRLQADQKGLTLTNRVEQPIPEFLFDSERIGQVLTNLIDNAIKATPPGGTIDVDATIADQYVQISVTDSGIGIPESEQRKIFSRFFQATNNRGRSSDDKGLGLGLAICQMIVEGHGGQITVESQEGVGSRFCIILPITMEVADEELIQRSA